MSTINGMFTYFQLLLIHHDPTDSPMGFTMIQPETVGSDTTTNPSPLCLGKHPPGSRRFAREVATVSKKQQVWAI